MKTTRRLLALITVLALILALGTTAFAEDPVKNDSITVTGTKVGETYDLYKMFDLVVDDVNNPTAYSYTVNSAWATFFAGDGAKYITVNNAGYVTAIKDAEGNETEDAKDLAKAAAAWSDKPTATQSIEAESTSVMFAGLADGYWLITSTLGTEAMIQTTPDKAAVKINEKNPENTIVKTVKEDSANTFGDSNDAQIGDTVEFKSVVTLNPGTRNVVVHDKMDSGLTYTIGSVAIEGLTKDTDYTVSESPADGDAFDVTFTDSYINGLTTATEVTITYNAVLNQNAIKTTTTGEGEAASSTTEIVPQKNSATVTYGDKQSVKSETTTTTHKFSVLKYDGGKFEEDADNKTALADAVFSLKKGAGDAAATVNLVKIDDNNYRIAKDDDTGTVTIFTTNATGAIIIWGVDADSDYSLVEITAPAGYNALTAPISVNVAADNNTVAEVENNAGSTLPSTGGMGTTIFYLLGGLMVLSALVVLVTNKRMRAN